MRLRPLREAFPILLKLAGNSSALAPFRADYEKALARGTFDYAAPMGDLLVHCLPDYVPSQYAPYLTADPQRLAQMKEFVAGCGPGRRIGIAWHTRDARDAAARSIPLAAWTPILETPGCGFFAPASCAAGKHRPNHPAAFRSHSRYRRSGRAGGVHGRDHQHR